MSSAETVILFVDDDLRYMLPIVERLEFAGYSVECMMTPGEAIEWFKAGKRPDLIICDLMMFNDVSEPIEQARVAGLRLIKGLPPDVALDCPVIILTGMMMDEIQEEARRLVGDDRVLTKPADLGELLATVADALPGRARS